MASQQSLAGQTATSQPCTRTEILPFRLWPAAQTNVHYLHSCDNGRLAPPAPSIDGTFLVIALQSPYFDSAFVQASGLAFRIGGDPPATYCPDEVAQLGDCPPGTETVWTCASGYCGLVYLSDSANFAQSLMYIERRGARRPADLHRPQRRGRLHPSTLRLRSAWIAIFRVHVERWGVAVWKFRLPSLLVSRQFFVGSSTLRRISDHPR